MCLNSLFYSVIQVNGILNKENKKLLLFRLFNEKFNKIFRLKIELANYLSSNLIFT